MRTRVSRGLTLALALLAATADAAPTATAPFSISTSAPGWWLLSPAGRPVLDLLPVLVSSADGRRQRVRFRVQRFRADHGSVELRAGARVGAVEYHLVLRGGDREPLMLRLEARYLRPTHVKEESLRFALASNVRVAVRDSAYRWRPVQKTHLAGVHAPRQVRLELPNEGVTVGWQSAGEGPQMVAASPGELSFELDHHANHPFFTFSRCVAKVAGYGGPSRWRSGTPRRAGELVRISGALSLGVAPRLVLERLPDGYASALVLTDHADQSSFRKLEAFAFGRSGALARGEVGPAFAGFVNRGLRYTKTIFLAQRGSYPRQFSDARFRQLLDKLAAAGVEVGVHSATGAADRPATTAQLLDAFRRRFKGRTWIDHQPYTNCEAISSRGWDPASRWYTLDVLAKAGFRYLWGVPDVSVRGGLLDLLGPGRRPLLYTHRLLEARGRRFVVFRSGFFYWPWRRFLRQLGPPALDALERSSGLAIGHVYLDTYRRDGRHAPYGLIVAREGGYVLRPEVDALFSRLARRQARGGLWVTGIEALADHMHRVAGSQLDCAGQTCLLAVGAPWPEASARGKLTVRIDLSAGQRARDVVLLVDGRAAEPLPSPPSVARFRFVAAGKQQLEARHRGVVIALAGVAPLRWRR